MGDEPYGVPMSGGIPYAIGQGSVVRIPIPGTNGLCVELAARGYAPGGGSRSTLFLQSGTGDRHLRLDYGYNVRTQTVDYQWNQRGTFPQFGLRDHTAASGAAPAAYHAARAFRYAGRALVVVGVTIDVVSIVQANRPMRRASQVVSAWAGAWVGCKSTGAGGAALGTLGSPLATAVGGIVGCIVGGAGGYWAGSQMGGKVFDWAEGTLFTPLPEVALP